MDPINADATKEEGLPLIDAINGGKIEEAIKMVMGDPSLVNEVDKQSNTPLHYAAAQPVARHSLNLIKLLITNGANIDAKNRQGEIAADWFQPFFNTVYRFNSDVFKVLRQSIERGHTWMIVELLKKGVSLNLRFSQANTILHEAIVCQQVDSVRAILEWCDPLAVKQLLRCENSQGMTPQALQLSYQLGTESAREIINYLQKKQDAVVPEGGTLSVPAMHKLPSNLPCVLQPIDVEYNKINELEDALRNYRQAQANDFMLINPLRSTIVKLAYNISSQANHYYRCTDYLHVNVPKYGGTVRYSMYDLFKKLFGTWTVSDRQIFRRKLFLSSGYLLALIEHEKIDEVIEFSTEYTHSGGWVSSIFNKIFLNPMLKSGVIGLVATLIHEITHKATFSYDFFSTTYYKTNKEFSISLKNVYALAAKGTSGQLTEEKRQLFEVRQLLESSNKDPNLLKKELFHWKALHSAETLTVAILALATIPTRYACLGSYPHPALLIKPKFIRFTHIATHPEPPAPERPLVFCPYGEKRDIVSSSERFDGETRPGTANSDSGISSAGSSTAMDWCATDAQASLSHLTQEMVSTPPPPTEASLALSPEALPPTQVRNHASLACSANIRKP